MCVPCQPVMDGETQGHSASKCLKGNRPDVCNVNQEWARSSNEIRNRSDPPVMRLNQIKNAPAPSTDPEDAFLPFLVPTYFLTSSLLLQKKSSDNLRRSLLLPFALHGVADRKLCLAKNMFNRQPLLQQKENLESKIHACQGCCIPFPVENQPEARQTWAERIAKVEKKEKKAHQSFLPLVHLNILLVWGWFCKMYRRAEKGDGNGKRHGTMFFFFEHFIWHICLEIRKNNDGFMCRPMDTSSSHPVLTQIHSVPRNVPDPFSIICPSACRIFSWRAALGTAPMLIRPISPWNPNSAASTLQHI